MDEILFEKVKNYFSGQMSPEEQLQFKAELTTNKDLATVFDLYQTIEKGLFDTEESAAEEGLLRNTLKEVHERYIANELQQDAEQTQTNEEKQQLPESDLEKVTPAIETSKVQSGKIRRLGVWKSLAIAATVIGVILVGSIWYLQKEKSSPAVATVKDKGDKSKDITIQDTAHPQINTPTANIATQDKHKTPEQKQDNINLAKTSVPDRAHREALYARNFKPDAIPSNFPDLLQEALSHFKDQEYKDVIAAIDIDAIKTSMEELRPRGQPDEQQEKEEKQTLFYAYYYKALSYMADNNAAKAIPEFQNALTKSPDKFWQGKAQWYLALAYLKAGKIDGAKMWLKQVVNNNKAGEYKQKALQLISELEGNQ
ncbi:MAG: tetratricopeptide repeat protein [Chitinophagaceae bacterium]|nr:tetratricopeptide repeat protein [Chitinophagaceae bacterium]